MLRLTHLGIESVPHYLRRTVAPTALPVDLDAVKEHLRLGSITDDDRRLADEILPSAVERVEKDSRRSLMTQTWVLNLDWFPCEIELRRPPVQSITSIQYVDTGGATQTLATSVYETDLTTEPPRIRQAWSQTWPSIRYVTNAVTVTFVAGYSSAAVVPAIAKRAILLACEEEYYGCDVSAAYNSLISRLQWGGYC